MTTIGVRELKARAPEILRRVSENREEVIITRHGRPQARVVPIEDSAKLPGKSLRGAYRGFPKLTDEDFLEAKRIWHHGVE